MGEKKIVIDLRWVGALLLLPIVLTLRAVQFVIQTVMLAFIATGIGYGILKLANLTGFSYTAFAPQWSYQNRNSLKFQMTQAPHAAFRLLGFKARTIDVVTTDGEEFYNAVTGQKLSGSDRLKGFYARFKHEQPSVVKTTKPVPQPGGMFQYGEPRRLPLRPVSPYDYRDYHGWQIGSAPVQPFRGTFTCGGTAIQGSVFM